MQLRYAATSPFVRKVLVIAIEAGLADRIEKVAAPGSPLKPNREGPAAPPLAKIPALLTDDGQLLYDSPVICEYLDGLHGGAKMFPASGTARWTALRRQALADGMMDAAVARRGESRRPANEQSPVGMELQRAKVVGGLAALESEADKLGNGIDIGLISIACALGYLDFRFGAEEWRKGHPKLARWFEDFSKRPSMQSTVAKDA
jgi:glutathione S-transferase